MSTKHLLQNFQKVVLPASGRSPVLGEGAQTTEPAGVQSQRHWDQALSCRPPPVSPEWEPLQMGVWDYFI